MSSLWVQWLKWMRALLLGGLDVASWWKKLRDEESTPVTRLAATLLMGIGLVLLVLSLREPPQPIPPGTQEIVIDLNERTTTNAEIAERLSISPRTVEAHVGNIIAKLGAQSRTEAVRIAVEKRIIR